MSNIVKGMQASCSIVRVPMSGTPTNAADASSYAKLHCELEFKDAYVKAPRFNNMEEPYVHAPRLGAGEWDNFPMVYNPTKSRPGVDVYDGDFYGTDATSPYLPGGVRGGVNLTVAERSGVSFGARTNVGEIYLQEYGETTPVATSGTRPPGVDDEYQLCLVEAFRQGFKAFGNGPQGYFVMDKDEQYWAFDPRTKTATTKIDPPRL
jgi:hypothetical protein